jgi:hypothetical protein
MAGAWSIHTHFKITLPGSSTGALCTNRGGYVYISDIESTQVPIHKNQKRMSFQTVTEGQGAMESFSRDFKL